MLRFSDTFCEYNSRRTRNYGSGNNNTCARRPN